MQTDAPPPLFLVFTKAAIRGGAGTDLFATQVDVGSYTNTHGTYVAAHRATRHKRLVQTVAPPNGAQPDLFAAPAAPVGKPAPKQDERQPSLFDAPLPVAPKEDPPAPTPEPAVEPPAAEVESTPEPEPEPKRVPGAIVAHVRRALAILADVAAGMADARAADAEFQGNGRYEADAYENQAKEREAAQAMLAKFRDRAAKLGIDPEETIRELGDEPFTSMSEAGKAYAEGARKPEEKAGQVADTPRAEAGQDPEGSPEEPEAPRRVEVFGVPAGTTPSARKKANARAEAILAAKTDEEMTGRDRDALARYTGSGGIGDSLSEFYTPPAVASAMWDMLRNAGFAGGEVLEPSCGTGVYAHTAPEGTRLAMVEMQPTSARIARILHGPMGHEVRQTPLEGFATTDGRQFDAVIGNVPFCPRGGLIKDDKPDIARAEQYFVDTALDKTKDGGLVALMVPTSVMDSANTRGFRERIMRKGEFLGAVRLPNTAFKAAHTEVTTDILVFRKRPQEVAGALSVLNQDQLKAAGIWDAEFLAGTYFEGRGSPAVMGRTTTKMGQFGEEMTVAGSMEGVPEALSEWAPEDSAAPSPTVPDILESLGDDPATQRSATNAALRTPYQVARVGDIRVMNGVRYVLQGEPPRWVRAGDEVPQAVEQAATIAEMLEDLSAGRARDPAYTRTQLIEALDEWVGQHGTPSRNRDLRAWLAAPFLPKRDGVEPEDHDAHVKAAYRRTARLLGAVNEDGTYSDLVSGRQREAEAMDLGTLGTKLALEQGGFTPDQLATAAGVHVDTVLDRLHAEAGFAIEADGKT